MCGRSSLTKNQKEIEQRFQSTFYSDELIRYNPLPNYNVAPTNYCPVITNDDPFHLRLFRWGLIPSWAKDHKVGYKMINARKETIQEKSTFKRALESRRCIVPFDGIYEWKKAGKTKTPYRIFLKNQEIFTLAGLWERWMSPQNEEVFSFTLITQPANEFMQELHDRMPVFLTQEQERLWIDPTLSGSQAYNLIEPIESDALDAYPVDNRVGNVRNNDAELIKPCYRHEE